MGKLKSALWRFTILLILVSSNFLSFSQVFDQRVADYILKVEHPLSFLQRIEKIGIKEPGINYKHLDSAYLWLKKMAEQAGYKTTTQNFLFGNDTLRNIEFVKKGSSDSCIVIGGHYDSEGGPGVNDNGTGDFAIYQIAKLLKGVNTKYTLRFVYFSGEEKGYLGSKYYVKTLNKDSVKIKFMLNLDQLGGTIDEDNSGVKCERDEVSPRKAESNLLAVSMSKVYSLYTDLHPVIAPAILSDYLSFRDSGYLISGIYQNSPFPFVHSESDLLKNIEFNSLISIVKGALAFVLLCSEAEVPAGIDKEKLNTRSVNVYFANKELVVITNANYSLTVYDGLGRLVFTKNGEFSEKIIPMDNFKPGVYFAWLKTDSGIICNKFLVEP